MFSMKDHVKFLTETIGERSLNNYIGLQQSINYITRELSSFVGETKLLHYTCDNKQVTNIEFTFQGTTDEVLIIGAHYDSLKGTVGANDNASGVAGLLKLIFHLNNIPHTKTIKFVFFTLEEPPHFGSHTMMGSSVYHQYCIEQNYNIVGMICLDLIGCYHGKQYYPYPEMYISYPKESNFIACIGKDKSIPLINSIGKIYSEVSSFPMVTLISNEFDLSDHMWFTKYGSVVITDTAMFRYKFYHSVKDTWDKLDYDKMEEMIEGLANTIKELVK